MSGNAHPHGCDPELIFELADETLDPERKHCAQTHLEKCQPCQELYERELDLNGFLSSMHFADFHTSTVSQTVVMSLPTRSVKARILWALLAFALLISALLAMELHGSSPLVFVMGILAMFQAFVSGFADVVQTVITIVWRELLMLLALGALVDLLIAFYILALTRQKAARGV